jgi:Lrp/AsnC family leucine-responsive transcriptional regulator
LCSNDIPLIAQSRADFALFTQHCCVFRAPAPFSSGEIGGRPVQLDAFDRKILTLLQKDSRMPQRDIGDAVHLSASAVNRRIAAMEMAGVITAYQAVVDPAKVGRPITVIAEVTVESERLDLLDAVKRRLLACPGVQQLYYVTGEVDIVIILTVADMDEYQQLTRQLFFFAESNVKSFRTMVAMERSKVSLAIGVE